MNPKDAAHFDRVLNMCYEYNGLRNILSKEEYRDLITDTSRNLPPAFAKIRERERADFIEMMEQIA